MLPQPKRCAWAAGGDERYLSYHDTEWGVPITDDRKLFEFIVLESAQAGLSWRTILGKREGYRRAFKEFNPRIVVRMDDVDLERLMADRSIIRNRQKIVATMRNARAFLEVQNEFGSFAAYMWKWVDAVPLQAPRRDHSEVPAQTPLAVTMSKDLKKRGFSFLGPTVWYAHMQAVGMVNDHTIDCFRHSEVAKLRPVW